MQKSLYSWNMFLNMFRHTKKVLSRNIFENTVSGVFFFFISAFVYCKERFRLPSTRCDNRIRSPVNGALAVPRPLSSLFNRSYSYTAPKLWNSIPITVSNSSSLTSFCIIKVPCATYTVPILLSTEYYLIFNANIF